MADLKTIRAVRLAKLRELEQSGVNPFPERTPPHTPIARIRAKASSLERSARTVGIAGRIVGLRPHGGLTFLDCADATGKIQVLLTGATLRRALALRLSLVDLGDFLSVRGRVIRTRRGELTIAATSYTILAKAIRPIPSSWYGLRDVEERFRAREVDLLVNEKVRERFRIRSAVLRSLREQLHRRGFLEVETPILQPIAGGANAEPFRTFLRALRMNLYLRIAPELYLKRLLVGGFERVFELGRAFRNEGMDQTHNPEFTILEFYWAYEDLEGLAAFSEELLRNVVRDALKTTEVRFRGATVHFGKPFRRFRFTELFRTYLGVELSDLDEQSLRRVAARASVPFEEGTPQPVLIDHLFKKAVVPKLIEPSFVFSHPIALSPLAKARADDPSYAARFQIVAGGMEIANAYAELNDPIEQRRRFLAEARLRRRGHREAQRADEDFLTALEYGMPPAAGFGLGVDRFVLLLTDAPSLREVILFPTMRPKRSR